MELLIMIEKYHLNLPLSQLLIVILIKNFRSLFALNCKFSHLLKLEPRNIIFFYPINDINDY